MSQRKYKIVTTTAGSDKLVTSIVVKGVSCPFWWERLFGLSGPEISVLQTGYAPTSDPTAISMVKQRLTLKIQNIMESDFGFRK